jgi:GrpB-like predicted nucleotidyltransferase (UPF0157 family)
MTDDLNKLTTQELGHLFPIIIADYDSDWEKFYLNEKHNILSAININDIKRIEHIGSTAVPGLCAKPTIDILIEISDNTNCDLFINGLQKIQYHFIPRPDNPPPHIMLAKGYSKTGLIGQTFHIHIRYSGDWDEIIFRDYLIRNPDIARQYGDLKRRLSIEFKNDRERYTDSKTVFIKQITQQARDNLQ